MRLTDIYGGQSQASEGEPPATGGNRTMPNKQIAQPTTAAAVSWLGMLLALVLLRVLYEVSD